MSIGHLRTIAVFAALVAPAFVVSPATADSGDSWSGTFSHQQVETTHFGGGYVLETKAAMSGSVAPDPDNPTQLLVHVTVTDFEYTHTTNGVEECRQDLGHPVDYDGVFSLHDSQDMMIAGATESGAIEVEWAEAGCSDDDLLPISLAAEYCDPDGGAPDTTIYSGILLGPPTEAETSSGTYEQSCSQSYDDITTTLTSTSTVDLHRVHGRPMVASRTTATLPRATTKAGTRAKVVVKVTAKGETDVHGTVSIYDNQEPIATGTVTNGKATIRLPALHKGKHYLMAYYAGGGHAEASWSKPVTLKVK